MEYSRLAAAAIPIRYVAVLLLATVSVRGEIPAADAGPSRESLEDRLDRVESNLERLIALLPPPWRARWTRT